MARKSRDSRDDGARDDRREAREAREPRAGRRRDQDSHAGQSNAGLIWGAAIGGVLALVGVIVLVLALAGGGGTPGPVTPNPAGQSIAKGPGANTAADAAKPATPPKNDPKIDPSAQPKIQPQPVAVVPVIDRQPPEQAPKWTPTAKAERPYLVTDPAGHSAVAHRCMFTPDGEHVITVSSDKSVRVWDWRTGETARIFRLPIGPAQEGSLKAADISPDGKWLAVAGLPYGLGAHGIMIHVISLASGQVEKVLRGHKDAVADLSFSHDGRLLASASHDRTVRLYDVASGNTVRVLQGHNGSVATVAFSADDQRLATVSRQEKSVRVWSVANGATTAEIRDFPDLLVSAAWNPVTGNLATGCGDGSIQVWSVSGTRLQNLLIRQGDRLHPVALRYSGDGKELLYAGVGEQGRGRAGVLDLAGGKHRSVFKEHDNTAMDARFSKDGQHVVSCGGDANETFIWKVSDGTVVQKLHGEGKSVWGVGWRKDGKAIGWGNTNGPPEKLQPIEHSFVFDELELGPPPTDFGRVMLASGDYSLRRLGLDKIGIYRKGTLAHTFTQGNERFYAFSLIAGDRAIIGGESLYLVDVTSNKVLRRYNGHAGLVLSISPAPDFRHFLTGSTDETICLWDAGQSEPLLSFFVAGREWIAWTPQGYYAASPSGERLMGWLVNNGPDRLATFHPAARFHDSLYHPELIKLVFQEKSLAKALALANKQAPQQPVAEVHVEKVLPPEVAIVSPKGPSAALKQDKVEVRARAKSFGQHAVTGMRLLVNGRPHLGEKGVRKFADGKVGEVEAVWTLDVPAGKYQLAVIAESRVSKGLSPIVEVTRAGELFKEPANLYVLAAGISAYPGDMRLDYAHADAIAIEKVFKEKTKGLFKKVETRLLTDQKGTRKNIVEGLSWLEKTMTQRDVAIVFLAGHGTRDPLGKFHFIPVDVNEKNLAGSCVSGDLLKTSLANMPGRVVAMLDACHSGVAATDQKKALAEKAKKAAADGLVRDLVSEEYGVITMCSSLGREYSLESKSVGHGFFTLSVVEALTGRADFNKDGYIHIHEIDFYATARVRQLSQGQQNPTTGRPPNIRSFPLARLR